MIASYGYQDAEGQFFVTIDQDRCAACAEKPCAPACPAAVLVVEEDPYGASVAAVDDRRRRTLRYDCMGCKPAGGRPALPCVAACPFGAIVHSW